MKNRGSRIRARGVSAGVVLAIIALAIPSLVAAANITVNAIPGGGWIQGPDNTAGRSAVIATSPAAGLGTSSVKLTTTANTDFVGIGRAVPGPLSDITAGAWMTYVTGAIPAAEAASLRFGMYRLGGTNEFTTMSVEAANNGTVTAGTWQTWTLSDTAMVWQTNAAGAFCLQASPCTYAAFKTQYPNATVLGLQVAIGTGVPATTSYVDGVSLTIAGDPATTDTWNFELAAAGPTPPRATAPPTDLAAAATDPGSFDARPLIVLGFVSLIALLSISLRRTRPTH